MWSFSICFWDITPCSLVEFSSALNKCAVRFCKTLPNNYQSTRRHNKNIYLSICVKILKISSRNIIVQSHIKRHVFLYEVFRSSVPSFVRNTRFVIHSFTSRTTDRSLWSVCEEVSTVWWHRSRES